MEITNIHNAKTHFSKYLKKVCEGEEVIICASNKPVAKLVAYNYSSNKRRANLFKGKITINKDFDKLPSDFIIFFTK